jgi:hypothetical protein
MTLGNDVRITPVVQSVMSTFIGIYKPIGDSFDRDINAMPASLMSAGYITPYILVAAWVILGSLTMMFSIARIHKKDIN